MKKLFTKILISAVMVAIFLAPVSTSFQKNKEGNLAIVPKINTVEASTYTSAFQDSSIVFNDATSTTASFLVNLKPTQADWDLAHFINGGLGCTIATRPNSFVVAVFDENNNYVTSSDFSPYIAGKTTSSIGINLFCTFTGPTTISDYLISVSGLTAGKNYKAGLYYESVADGNGNGINLFNSTDKNYYKIKEVPLNTPTGNQISTGNDPTLVNQGANSIINNDDFGCKASDITTWFQQCIVGAVYHLIWEPIAKVTEWAAAILDFFVYYSTNSSSYSGSFISSAWASVRDIANIFFIIALLYVAIQTILGMGHGHGGKQMIATIVVVALLINFSLFFTEVIIDASNILAKVFYNHIDAKGHNGEAVGLDGQKSITVSLVSSFNPQLIMADKAATQPGLTFVMILISIALMVFMIIIFLSVAILFVGRVAGLWIAMIFAPIAFASYTLPFDIPGFGHREWWNSLLKQAFLAPIFIFFLYIILLLGQSFHLIARDTYASDSTLNTVMTVIIPFMLIYILLDQAKKLAVTYSGEMGAAFAKVGGFAMGAVGGLAAFGLTAGVGKLATKVAGSTGLQEAAEKKGMAGFGARMALRTADYGTKATFDIRKSPIGSMLASQGMDLKSGTGMIGLGENVTTGGFKGVVAKKQEKIEKGAELFKTKMSDTEVKNWSTERATKKYEADKTTEQNRLGVAFNEVEFDKTHSKKPEFSTAKQLNESRLKTYKDNIGKTGLIYSAAASMTKEATQEDLSKAQAVYNSKDAKYKENNKPPTIASLTEAKIVTKKNIIGAAAVIATGGLGGLNEITTVEAEKGAIKSIEKELKKTDKIEKEMETLKERKGKIEKTIKDTRTEAGIAEDDEKADEKLEEYVETKLANIDNEIDSAKAEQAIHRNNRIIKQNEKATVEANPNYEPTVKASMLANIEREITSFKAQEDTSSSAAIVKIKEKQKYTVAKNSPNDLLNINTRMETLEGKTSHSKDAHGKDSGIKDAAKASSGGEGHAKPAAVHHS